MTDDRSRPSTEMALNALRLDFTSAINGKDYRLLISEPAGDPPADGWPVVYLIDGSLHFGIAVDTARIQGRWPDTAEAVIVGIAYPTDSVGEALTLRNHDLTPPTTSEITGGGWQRHMGATPADYGGMDAFLRVIEAEVKPRVREASPINPADQTLIGHSLGGLTTLTTLFRTPDAFQHYVAISPSIWVNGKSVLGFVDDFIASVRAGRVKTRLLLSTGENEEGEPLNPQYPKSGMPVSEEVFLDMMRSCGMVTYPAELAKRLEALPGLDFKFVIHADEDHRSVVPAGIARGIYFALYRP